MLTLEKLKYSYIKQQKIKLYTQLSSPR